MKTLRDYLKREPKVGYFTNFLNEKDGLNNHIKEMDYLDFDARLYIDGRFPGFPLKESSSTDGSVEIVKSMKNSYYVNLDEVTEMDKNNWAFEKAGELGLDFLIQVDADEWVEFDREMMFKSFEEEFESIGTFQYMTRFTNHWSSPPRIVNKLPRLFFKPEFIQSKNIHWWFYALGNRIVVDPNVIIEGIHVHHDDRVRSTERNNLMDKYQVKNMRREASLMHRMNKETGAIIQSHTCSFDPLFEMGKTCIICKEPKT